MNNQILPKRVTYVVSNMSKMIALEWICDYRNKELTTLSFVFLNSGNSEIEQFVKDRGCSFIRIPYHGKVDLVKAIFKTWLFLIKNKTEIVHCHLFDASLVGLFAALFTKVKKRIHTRHYATYHHVYFPKAVKYDRFINWLSTDIIAISQLVQRVLIENEYVSPKKIHLIAHGFLIEEYSNVEEKRVQAFKYKYNIFPDDVVIGVVARYTMLKGIQHIIPAFVRLLKDYPKVKLLIANSHGNDEVFLRSLLNDIPSQNLIEVKYERDMGALYKSLSIYVHIPISDHIEAFGQTYVEALMASVPSIFTLSGIAQEFIKDRFNALVVPFAKDAPVYEAMKQLLEDNELYQTLAINGLQSVNDRFKLPIMIAQLEELYCSN